MDRLSLDAGEPDVQYHSLHIGRYIPVILHFRCVKYFPPTVLVRVSVTVRVSLVLLVISANKSN